MEKTPPPQDPVRESTADAIRRAIDETSTCSEAAKALQVDVRELLKLARVYRIRLRWTKDWAR